MGAELDRVKARREAWKLVDDLYTSSANVYIVHYSCESFYENATGASLRVTSIAMRNLSTGQTKSWSLHKSAELAGLLESMDQHLDRLEMDMLGGYFRELEHRSGSRFLHWNMRDENFGFFALEHRFRVLGGHPFELQADKKVDLARVMVSLYGRNYAPHADSRGRKGRIMSLAEMNRVSDVDALTGQQEADAFTAGEYYNMHRSTLRKLDMFANFFERAHQRKLKVKSSWAEQHGVHPSVVIELAKNHWLISGVILAAGILGAGGTYFDFFKRFSG